MATPSNSFTQSPPFHNRSMWRHQVGDDIELRAPEETDLDELFDVVERNRPRLARWQHWAYAGRQKEDTANFIREARASIDNQSAFNLLIFHCAPEAQPAIIGSAGLLLINLPTGIGEIGYWIDADWEGKGIVTRCVEALIDEGFRKHQLARIQIRCAPKNTRSRAVARRLGFAYEGTLRRVLQVGEEVHDLEYYSLLRPEWEVRHSSETGVDDSPSKLKRIRL